MGLEAQILEQATDLLSSIKKRLAQYDIDFKPYTSQSLYRFNNIDLETRIDLVQTLFVVTRALNSAPGPSMTESLDVHVIRETCRRFGLREPKDFIPLLAPNDIIEIYDGPKKVQVFRNFTFLKYCSYDLLTLLTTPYPQLYWREEGVEERINKISEEVWRDSLEPRKWEIEDHVIYEKQGASNFKFKLEPKYVGPVFNSDGSRFGWISSIRAVPLGSLHDDLGNVRSLESRTAVKK